MKTDTTEKGLETLIMRHMTGADGLTLTPDDALIWEGASIAPPSLYWICGGFESRNLSLSQSR